MKRTIQFVPSVKTKNRSEYLPWSFKNYSIINDALASVIGLSVAIAKGFAGFCMPGIAAATGKRSCLSWKFFVETRLPESHMEGVVFV